jgi:uncharacterized protein YjbI with pentapeptide repeats
MEKLRLTKESLSKILDRHQNWAKSSDYYKKESDRADLSGIDLTNVPENMYRDKYLCGIIFNNSDMSGMNLFNKNMKGVWLNGACLRGTNLHSARLDESALYDTDFTDANLSTASIRQPRINAGTNFRRSCLFGTVISEPRIWHEKERTIRFLRALMWSAVVFMVACVIMHLLTKNPESFDLYLESAGIAFFMIVAAVYKWLTWTDPASITWRDICLYKKYCNWAGVNQRISINDIIAQRNISREKALEEINYLKRKKYISESGYDAQKGILQTFVYDDSETVEKSDAPVEKSKDSKSIFQKHLAVLEKTDVENTGGITEEVNRLKETVSKAEAHAAEYPDDGKKISSAVDRYASMAEEMVAVYSRLDRLEADGENATAIKESVKQGLKEINDALDKILDDLFSYERMDVEASVSAAETMMKADGAVKEQ